MTIWKFNLPSDGLVEMPKGATALSVRGVGSNAFMWAMVDPDAEREVVKLNIYGTGHDVENPGRFVGTFFLDDLGLVFHVFQPAE